MGGGGYRPPYKVAKSGFEISSPACIYSAKTKTYPICTRCPGCHKKWCLATGLYVLVLKIINGRKVC